MKVSAEPLTQEAASYAWRQLLTRAGADPDARPVALDYGKIVIPSGGPCISVKPCASQAWVDLVKRAPNTLCTIPAFEVVPAGARPPVKDPLPVLFWEKGAEQGNRPFAELLPNGSVVFHADVIAATFFMLSRWEEMVISTRDEHGRFPATASVAYKQGFLDRPIVDEYALVLREWIRILLPNWQPEPSSFAVKLSHDIDMVRRFPSWRRGLRGLGRALFVNRSPALAWQSIAGTLRVEHDPYFQGLLTLIRISEEQGLDSAFYLMAVPPTPFDRDLSLSTPIVKHCIQLLRERGFEIGFHPSSGTVDDFDRFMAEKKALEAALGTHDFGGRQHNLLFQVPHTWRLWEQAGLVYDSTAGYADHDGFRCGTCHRFHPFDIERNRELNILEVPLIAMDATFRKYLDLTCEEAEARILELARRCRQVGGTFALLWHNSSFGGAWAPWAHMYRKVAVALAKMQGNAAG